MVGVYLCQSCTRISLMRLKSWSSPIPRPRHGRKSSPEPSASYKEDLKISYNMNICSAERGSSCFTRPLHDVAMCHNIAVIYYNQYVHKNIFLTWNGVLEGFIVFYPVYLPHSRSPRFNSRKIEGKWELAGVSYVHCAITFMCSYHRGGAWSLNSKSTFQQSLKYVLLQLDDLHKSNSEARFMLTTWCKSVFWCTFWW